MKKTLRKFIDFAAAALIVLGMALGVLAFLAVATVVVLHAPDIHAYYAEGLRQVLSSLFD
jgi:hypothetical protein